MDRIGSLPMPSGELFDLLKVNPDGGNDLLPFEDLEWVLDEAADLPDATAVMDLGSGGASDNFAGSRQDLMSGAVYQPAASTHSGATGESSHMPLPGVNGTASSRPPAVKFESSAAAPAGPVLSFPGFPPAAALAPAAAGAAAAAAPASTTTSRRGGGRRSSAGGQAAAAAAAAISDGDGSAPPKKKRTRNAEQMAQNRVAQQKYRERKKAEHEELQNALEQLTAQLAAMKALEVQAAELRANNAGLQATVTAQAQQLQQLTLKVEEQSQALAAAREQAKKAEELASTQQRMILDQHAKLQLQEEVIEALRGRLKERVEDAFGSRDPKTVCQNMCAAVRTALQGAKNVEGLQEALEKMPEEMITEVCRAILCEVKKMWPELAERFRQIPGFTCSQAATAAPCGA